MIPNKHDRIIDLEVCNEFINLTIERLETILNELKTILVQRELTEDQRDGIGRTMYEIQERIKGLEDNGLDTAISELVLT